MTGKALHLMGSVPQLLPLGVDAGEAIGKLLKQRHPMHTAKYVARDLQCDVRTAENVLNGHLSKTTLTRLIRAYGFDFLLEVGASVLAETLEQHEQRRLREIADERRELDEMEAGLRNRWAARRALSASDGGALRLVHPQDSDADSEDRRPRRSLGAGEG